MAALHRSSRAMMAALMLVVSGCASRGNEVLKAQDTATIDTAIVDGQTTRDDVFRVFGAPEHTTFLTEKNEVWTYRWARATAQGQNFIPIVGAFARGYDVRKKELTIVFNERNVVARHTMTDTNDSVKSGLLDTGAPGALANKGSVSSSVPGALTAPPPAPASVAPATSAPAAATSSPAAPPASSSMPTATPNTDYQSRFRL